MHNSFAEDFLVPAISLPPVRGIVPLHNRAGQPFPLADLHRLVRYQCRAFQVQKLDLFTEVAPPQGKVESLLAFAREFQVSLSLRTSGAWAPEALARWREQGLVDVCLASATPSTVWLDAARKAGLVVRLLMPGPQEYDAERVGVWSAAGVRQVTFLTPRGSDVAKLGEWRGALAARRIGLSSHTAEEVAAVFSELVDPDGAYFLDHAQYQPDAYRHARGVYLLRPRALRAKLIFDNLSLSGIDMPSDRWVVHFLRNYTPLFTAVQSLVRLARHTAPGNAEVPVAQSEAESARAAEYLDGVDLQRLHQTALLAELASDALAWEGSSAPSQTFESETWGFDNVYHDPLPGVNQMHALLPGERRSSRLPYLGLPFMVSVNFGGGMAESIGFAIGRHIRIACPMVSTAHQLTLYADAAGRYVLLRDGEATLPVLHAGKSYLPPRLPDGAHLQVAVWNPESSLSVTALRVWQGAREANPTRRFAVSVVVFSTRFSRRLQAVLECVAHQQGVGLEEVQCVVGIVPGLDASEDVLDSLHRVYPSLHVEPVMLPASIATAKGFALNECLQRVSAPLTVLLDSDILMPPDFLRMALDASAEHGFLAPAGRAMLDADATARVLLGQARPWESFETLAAGAPEVRVEENPQQVPLGYCQVFRSEALQHLRYAEYDHFQGADYEFGEALKAHFGGVRRLPRPVLHLHHDTRQWFGAQKQY